MGWADRSGPRGQLIDTLALALTTWPVAISVAVRVRVTVPGATAWASMLNGPWPQLNVPAGLIDQLGPLKAEAFPDDN